MASLLIPLYVAVASPVEVKAPSYLGADRLFFKPEITLLAVNTSVRPLDVRVFATMVEDRSVELLNKMKKCESTGNPLAINPRDTDGTPSFGCLQFKPSTLKMYAKRYGLADPSVWEWVDTQNFLYDCDFQSQIFLMMLNDPKVRFASEFPACYARNRDLFNIVLNH